MRGDVQERARILVVDDEPIPLEFCSSVLERSGYDVLTASSGAQALKFFQARRSRVDLAVLDIVMKGMSGIELAHRIQQISPGTRIALMSGYAPDEVKRLVGHDAAPYRSMWKPFTAEALVRMIQNVLAMPVREPSEGTAAPKATTRARARERATGE